MIAQHEDTGNAIYKMAIAPAAINTVDQLVISRSMMFENIYYHQKTLTAEEMLRYAMLNMDESTEGILDDFSNILRLTDSIVIHNDFSKSITNEIKKINIVDYDKYEKACELLSNLYNRQLFKRCVAFTDRNLTRVIAKKKDFYSRVIAGGIVEEQEEFVNQVVKEIERLKCILTASKFHYNEKTDVLLLIAPDISVASIDSNISIDDKMHKDRDMEFEADNWLKSRAARKAQNYLVSYPEDRYLVYIASEVILLREYGVLINDMIIYTEEDEKYINRIKEYLYSNNYFSEIYMLAPESIINSYESDINELIGKWKSYEIFDVQMGTGLRLDKTYLILHIKQYIRFRKEIGEFDVFLNGYIKMLLQMRIVSKEDITKALNINFKRILDEESCEKSEIKVCNIGNMQDSSALIAYHMNIVNCCLKAKWNTQQLEEILENSDLDQRIVFVEDAFCSGKQILSVFETYMGISIEERQTKETHVLELSEELKEKLRNCKLFFSFVFYEQENETFFYDRLKEIGLTNVKIIAKEAFPNGYFKTKCTDESQHERDIVKKYLERAGTELINWKAHDSEGKLKESWSIERQKDSILGYNDAQQLVAFSWNTPTYTMTPLWLGVDCDKLKWIPLFPRIDK